MRQPCQALRGVARGPERRLCLAAPDASARARPGVATGRAVSVSPARAALRYAPPAGGSARRRPCGGPRAHSPGAKGLRLARPPGTLQPPRAFVPRTRRGWAVPGGATSRTCPNRVGAGPAWPLGSTTARARSWAGTGAGPGPGTWSARPPGVLWPCPGRALASACVPTRVATARPPASRTCWPATGPNKAGVGAETTATTPYRVRHTPNRLGAGSQPNCPAVAASPACPKPSAKSATTSPLTTLSGAVPPVPNQPPTASKPFFKPRPSAVHLD